MQDKNKPFSFNEKKPSIYIQSVSYPSYITLWCVIKTTKL
jgi:hypothetical protein